jgi:itaconyl-CoA hydratase
VKLPHPLFEGDTVYSSSEVLEARPSKTRPDVGIVRVKTSGSNQAGQIVIEFTRTFMVWKRGHVPASGRADRK